MKSKPLKARVTSEHKGLYIAKSEGRDYSCRVTGGRMHKAMSRDDFPVVGDWILFHAIDEENGTIVEILPRKTTLTKKAYRGKTHVVVANVDVAFIVESIGRDYSLNRFERYLVLVKDGSIIPVLVLNKIDTISKDVLHKELGDLKQRFPDLKIILTSAKTGEGVGELKAYIKEGMTYCFLGSSGVGKSTLVNSLLGGDIAKTGELGRSSQRGTHTTTVRNMYTLRGGGFLIDTPGTREVGTSFVNVDKGSTFDDLKSIAVNCKYSDCGHVREPDCAILRAVESGQIDVEKYNNYIKLREESNSHSLGESVKKWKS